MDQLIKTESAKRFSRRAFLKGSCLGLSSLLLFGCVDRKRRLSRSTKNEGLASAAVGPDQKISGGIFKWALPLPFYGSSSVFYSLNPGLPSFLKEGRAQSISQAERYEAADKTERNLSSVLSLPVVLSSLFDPLTRFDYEHSKLLPLACESWEASEDARIFTFHLRRGARFHNGETVRSQNFKNSWEKSFKEYYKAEFLGLQNSLQTGKAKKASAQAQAAQALSPADVVGHFPSTLIEILGLIEGSQDFIEGKSNELVGIVCPDDLTLVVRLRESFAELPLVSSCLLFSPQASEPLKGNGAFSFERLSTEALELRRFDEYLSSSSYVDALQFKLKIEDDAQAVQQLERGFIDYTPLSYQEAERQRETFGVEVAEQAHDTKRADQLLSFTSLSSYYLGFNCKSELFEQVSMRRAVHYMLDREGLNEYLAKERLITPWSLLPPWLRFSLDSRVKKYLNEQEGGSSEAIFTGQSIGETSDEASVLSYMGDRSSAESVPDLDLLYDKPGSDLESLEDVGIDTPLTARYDTKGEEFALLRREAQNFLEAYMLSAEQSVTLKLIYPNEQGPKDHVLSLVSALEVAFQKLGFILEAQGLSLEQYYKACNQGEYDLCLLVENFNYPSPYQLLARCGSSSFHNAMHYSSESFDQYLTKAQETVDDEKRQLIYYEALRELERELPLLALGYKSSYGLRSARVNNFYMNPQENVVLAQSWLSE